MKIETGWFEFDKIPYEYQYFIDSKNQYIMSILSLIFIDVEGNG